MDAHFVCLPVCMFVNGSKNCTYRLDVLGLLKLLGRLLDLNKDVATPTKEFFFPLLTTSFLF